MSTAVGGNAAGHCERGFATITHPLSAAVGVIELLAGIPSVVYGFWGLVVLVPIIGRIHPPGAGWPGL